MILNIGCGGGNRFDKRRWYGDVRVDIKDFPNVTDVYDAHRLPEEWTDRFEKVVCYASLEHFECPYRAVLEMRRVLNPDGEIEILVPNPFHWRKIAYTLWKTRQLDKIDYQANMPNHKQAWDFIEMRNLCSHTGLRIVKVEYLTWMPEWYIPPKNLLEKIVERAFPSLFNKADIKYTLKKRSEND